MMRAPLLFSLLFNPGKQTEYKLKGRCLHQGQGRGIGLGAVGVSGVTRDREDWEFTHSSQQ